MVYCTQDLKYRLQSICTEPLASMVEQIGQLKSLNFDRATLSCRKLSRLNYFPNLAAITNGKLHLCLIKQWGQETFLGFAKFNNYY